MFGSVGAAVMAYERGAHVLRVHDVAATRHALDVAAAIRAAGAAP
jgi:dihydropteroate synthase